VRVPRRSRKPSSADVEVDDSRVELALGGDPEDPDRDGQVEATGACGPRIEVEHPAPSLHRRSVRVPRDDDGESRGGWIEIEVGQVVDHVGEHPEPAGAIRSELHHLALREGRPERAAVGVAAHGEHGGESAQPIEDLRAPDVSGMNDHVRPLEGSEGLLPEQPVGIGDHRDGTHASLAWGSGFVGLPGRGRSRHVAPTDIAPATVHNSRPMDLSFHTLDVFTDRTFGGNPLGVFPDAAHLPSDLMQRIAKEMNLSETVFLGPAETEEGTARVRIFTPGREVPFAGHPTVGSAIYLAAEAIGSVAVADTLDASGSGEITLVLEENVGPVPVDVKFTEGRPVFARFTTAVLPEHRPSPHTVEALAQMIGLDPSDIGGTGPRGHALEPEMVSCGLEYFVIPVRTLDAVRRSVLDTARWQRMLADAWAHHVYVVCMDAEGDGVDVHVRMYAPGSGVPEDPATGSAAAALGGYLSGVDGRDEASLSWTVEQGLEIGRPSLLYVEADRSGGATSAVRVGGSAVPVARGTMTVPDEG